ncbi:MAG TPA: hypothetical protein VMX13_00315 [Sedimentisphaerales bacterium]|nr:hypothetical protein [Sedimentisphaerales bacterium]
MSKVAIGLSAVILLLLVIGVTLLVLLRLLGFSKSANGAKSLPKSAPAGNRVSRAAEAIIMLCAGVAILVFTATNPSTNGMLLRLDQLRPAFAATNVIVALCAGFGVLIAALICRLWRTSPAAILMTIVLCAYGWLLNGPPGELIERLDPQGSTRPMVPFCLRLSRSSAVGAELWVNGVCLGKMPVQTTIEEFLEKVPYWPEPPEGYKDRTDEVHKQHYNPRGGRGYSIYQRWAQFELPELPRQYRIGPRPETEGRYYYARVKYDDEWGYFDGGGGGGGGGGRYTYRASRYFPAVFPKRQQRLEKMLDKARLSDYRVDADWFRTMETFGPDGPLAIRRAMDKEPDMINVLDDWATWKYGLDQVTDAESAWSVFQRICAEADLLQSYSTAGVAGRAVELLAPHLDAQRVVKRAVKLIHSTRIYGWSSWMLNGRLQFGFSYRPEGLATGLGRTLAGSHGGRGNRLPVSGYAVAHAVWMLDEFLDAQDDSTPNIVERKVVPALLCWHNDWTPSLRIAACLGGPDIGRFLWRQNWRSAADQVPFKHRTHLAGEDVNGWLFLLANLRSPQGAKFRREHARTLMDMADRIHPESIEDYGLLGQNPFGFLFIDNNLALKYWPRFRARTASRDKGYRALKQQFHYLVNMEPVSTVDMYVNAWRAYSHDYDNFQEALSALKNLAESKKEKVISAIEQAIKEDVSHIKGFPGDDEDGCRDYLLRHIEDDEWTANREARDIIENLKAGTDKYKGEAVATWLERAKPDHPLVKMLAESEEPELRLLVMGALKAHPTPENRKVLEKLLNDSDERVRSAAMEVQEDLKVLAAVPLGELGAVVKLKEERI